MNLKGVGQGPGSRYAEDPARVPGFGQAEVCDAPLISGDFCGFFFPYFDG